MQIQSLENITPIDDWQSFRRDGDQFLSTALAAHQKKKKAFNAEAIYNLATMAIEKFVMAFLMRHGDLADNHTMQDLVESLEKHLGPQPELAEKFRFMDSFQEICDPYDFTIITPTEEDLVSMLETAVEVQQLLAPYTDETIT